MLMYIILFIILSGMNSVESLNIWLLFLSAQDILEKLNNLFLSAECLVLSAYTTKSRFGQIVTDTY